MSRIKGKDTGLEMRVRSELHKRGFRFRKHVKELPGKPDVVFTKARVAVFIDGDFWHGYRFPSWEHKLSDFWKQKIERNRERDRRNRRKLKEMGWTVIRLWQHDLEHNFPECIEKIMAAVNEARSRYAGMRKTEYHQGKTDKLSRDLSNDRRLERERGKCTKGF